METSHHAQPLESNPPGTRTYEVIAYGALSAVFLVQLFDDIPLGGLLAFGCGLLGLMSRLQLGPILYLVLIAGNQLAQYNHGITPRDSFRPIWLDLRDLVTCVGVVAFVAVHYRLHGIWYYHLAHDPRRRAKREPAPIKSVRDFFSQMSQSPDPQRRLADQISQAEISRLLWSLPFWALLAQIMTGWIPQTRVPGIPPWMLRIVGVAGALSLGTFVVVNLVDNIWHRYGLRPTAAWLSLQDTVWRETRGEQRTQQRWLAWQRMLRKGS